MIHGLVAQYPCSWAEVTSRMKNFMAIDHSDHYEINSGNLHAGFYLNKKLPYTKHDCLYQDDQKQLTILKAGAIYNRISLLSELSKDLTLSDTELICHLFRKYGPRFVNRLNGGFAICIYDSRIHKVFLFRDHVGIYPLAYKIENGYLIFSSDIISLSRVFYNPENFNNDFLVDLFKVIIYKTVPDKNVVQLLPGTFLEFSFNETKLIKYWNPGDVQEDKKIKKLEFLTEIKYLLENSISIRSDYRFQAGSHVSGGLDSGIVSVIARKNFSKQKDFFGFSWTPFESPSIENKGDERDLVNKICQKAGIIPIFTKLSEAEYIKAIPNYYEHSANIYEDIVRSTASTHGINLIFSGFGGDEFLSKADSGILSDLFFRLHWKLLLKKYPLKHPRKLFNKLIYNVMFPWIGCLDPSSQRMYRQITEYLKDEHKKYNREQLRHLHFYRSRREMQLNVIDCYYNPQRIDLWNIAGFRKGIEYRYPLLDKRIIELMLKVPSKFLCSTPHPRSVIREISSDILPEEVRWNLEGIDPVFSYQVNEYSRKAAIYYYNELHNWQGDECFQFIDYMKLMKDMDNFKKNPNINPNTFLIHTILLLKSLHEFMKIYKS